MDLLGLPRLLSQKVPNKNCSAHKPLRAVFVIYGSRLNSTTQWRSQFARIGLTKHVSATESVSHATWMIEQLDSSAYFPGVSGSGVILNSIEKRLGEGRLGPKSTPLRGRGRPDRGRKRVRAKLVLEGGRRHTELVHFLQVFWRMGRYKIHHCHVR